MSLLNPASQMKVLRSGAPFAYEVIRAKLGGLNSEQMAEENKRVRAVHVLVKARRPAQEKFWRETVKLDVSSANSVAALSHILGARTEAEFATGNSALRLLASGKSVRPFVGRRIGNTTPAGNRFKRFK